MIRHSTAQYEGYYELGYIAKTHGVKGDVIIVLDTDSPERYRKMKSIFLEQNNTLLEKEVATTVVQEHDKTARVHLLGTDDMTAAEQLIRTRVFMPLSFLPPLRGKDFYYHEIIGYLIVDEEEGELGPLLSVYDLLQHPVGEIEWESKKVMFPLIDEFIKKIDRNEKKIFLNLPAGLLDVYR